MAGAMTRARVVTLFVLGLLLMTGPAWAGIGEWTGNGPEGAAVRAILVDPATPTTVYIGTLGSGVFKSTDGGATWAPVGTAELGTRTVRALVAGPPGTIYAGVEDAAAATSGGVFQSTDGGETWTGVDSAPPNNLVNRKVQALVWDGTYLYAGTRHEDPTNGGVYRWDGLGWTLKSDGLTTQSSKRVQALAVDPRTNPPVVYAGTQGDGVFKSTDSAGTWNRIEAHVNPNQGFRSDCLEKPEILALVVDTTIGLVGGTNAVLYAGATGDVGNTGCDPTPAQGGQRGKGAGFFRYVPFGTFGCTDDAIGCWDRRMAGAFEDLRPETLSAEFWSIAMNPNVVPPRIFVGTDLGVFVSNDSAGSWDGVPNIEFADGLVGMPIRALAIDVTDTCAEGDFKLYAGSGGRGMFNRCFPLGETPWTSTNSGLNALRAQSVAVGQRGGQTAVFGGLVGGGVITSVDGAATWQVTAEDSLNVRAMAVDPIDPHIVYAATGKGVIKTTTGGDAWTSASAGLPTDGTQDPANPPRTVRAIAIDPATPNVLYAAVGGLYRTVDAGATWTVLNGNLPAAALTGNGAVSAILVDRHSSGGDPTYGTLYIAVDLTNPDEAGVYRSTDGGATWTSWSNNMPTADRRPVALAFDPLSSSPTLFAGTSTGKVFKRAVNGSGWLPLGSATLPGQPISSLLVRISAPSRVYAATNGGGVFSIPANAENVTGWTDLNDGLTSLSVTGLGFDPEGSGTLFASTLGRGIFDFQIPSENPPLVIIDNPLPPTYTAAATPVTIEGTGTANLVIWTTNRGHAGIASGSWQASVVLELGPNLVTITGVSGSEQKNERILVTLDPPDPPDAPAGLGQFKADGSTAIAIGGTTTETTVVLKATLTDPSADTVKLQVEVRPVGTAFTNVATGESSLIASGNVASVTVNGLSAPNGYHWQARAVNSAGAASAWVAFGNGNPESSPDFSVTTASSCLPEVIVNNLAPGASGPTGAFTGTWILGSAGYGGNGSLVSNGADTDTYTFKTPVLNATQACTYQVFARWVAAAGRSDKVPIVVIGTVNGNVNKKFNQQINGGTWMLHGTYTFPANIKAKVRISDVNGKANADAVRFVLVP